MSSEVKNPPACHSSAIHHSDPVLLISGHLHIVTVTSLITIPQQQPTHTHNQYFTVTNRHETILYHGTHIRQQSMFKCKNARVVSLKHVTESCDPTFSYYVQETELHQSVFSIPCLCLKVVVMQKIPILDASTQAKPNNLLRHKLHTSDFHNMCKATLNTSNIPGFLTRVSDSEWNCLLVERQEMVAVQIFKCAN